MDSGILVLHRGALEAQKRALPVKKRGIFVILAKNAELKKF
jgi:hypothetical protein